MTKGSDGQLTSDAIVALMVAAGHIERDLAVACEKHGITHDQYNVLRILRGSPAGLPRGEIGTRMINRAPDVTRMLDRLDAKKLIKRAWDPDNRRLSIATVTREGLALLDKVDVDVAREQARFTRELSRSDLQTLRGLCRRLIA